MKTPFLAKQTLLLPCLLAVGLGLAHPGLASDGGTLVHPRYFHTATLLQDGAVLLAGGLLANQGGGYIATNTCELYDPGTNSWSLTGNMHQARWRHATVRLADGRLLVAGGIGLGNVPLSSAEIYDPATGQWTMTGSMSVTRSYFDSALLPSGKVLVAGSGGDDLQCELFDPSTGTWAPTGSLIQRRNFGSRLTVLATGKVLIVGGHSQRVGYLSETELYNPATGTWAKQGRLAFGRYTHAQVLLPDGRVMVAGGVINPPFSNTITRSTEIYDPNTLVWMPGHPLTTARSDFSANLLTDGQVVAAGGFSMTFTETLDSTEEFDPATNAWTALSTTLSPARGDHTGTTLLDGSILLAGGFDPTGKLIATAELLVNPQ